ncbi:MAG: hypothetical protein HQM09_21870 [Candidatus Riflebacteria bacterium]|nr:hypothetical protein [Candidatus Riflebacteria bacterium]
MKKTVLARQIVLRYGNGVYDSVVIPNKCNVDVLMQRLYQCKYRSAIPLYLHCDYSCIDIHRGIIRNVWPSINMKKADERLREATVKIEVKLSVTSAFFRAIAKIGFHYFLAIYKDRVNGREPEFRAIREFILGNGDETEKYVTQKQGHIIAEMADKKIPSKWCHIIVVDKSEFVVSRIQLFAGPHMHAPVNVVNIGRYPGNSSRQEMCGHMYIYRDPDENGIRKPGVVCELKSFKAAQREQAV